MAKSIDTKQIAMRAAHRLRAIAIKERLVPVSKPNPDDAKKTGGELRRSIHVSQTGYGAMVGTNKVYARAVHEGRKALIIRPKNKKALRFKIAGAFIYAKQVFQKKRTGRPFFRQALDIFEKNMDTEVAGLGVEGEMATWLAQTLRSNKVTVQRA